MNRAGASVAIVINSVLKCWIRPAVNVMRKSTILSSTQSKTLSARLLRTKFEWFWSEPSMGYLTHSVQFS
jgi:hypothetical protein